MKTVIVQGLGFVGAVMSVAVAIVKDSKNIPLFSVIGLDQPTNSGKERIDKINLGIFPFKINDRKLDSCLEECVQSGNLVATDDKGSYGKADVVIVSINCDLLDNDGVSSIDLDRFQCSVKDIADHVTEDTLIIVESTVPPGTCEKIINPLLHNTFVKRGLDPDSVYLAHSYERVMPGENYLNSITNYWRVYAGINERSADKCEEFLVQIINASDYPLSRLSSTTASEIGKLLENSYRATNIAFIEEWGRFAESVGVDIYEVIEAVRKRSTHSNIRQPGFGVGGYCLTKDPLFAKIAAKEIFGLGGHDFPFSSKAVEVNKKMPLITLEKIKAYYNGSIIGKKILIMGVSYKQDIGDTRYSPSETFYHETIKAGAEITGDDPMVEYWEEIDTKVLNDLPPINEYDIVVFAVPHREFRDIDFRLWIPNSKECLIFDANNVLTKKQLLDIARTKCGYLSIGRG